MSQGKQKEIHLSLDSTLECDMRLTSPFQADRDPRERGPRPLNSNR